MSLEELPQAYLKLQTLDTRSRFNAIKTLAHQIHQHYSKDAASIEAMELYIKLLKETIKFHGNRYAKLLNKIIGDWLEKTGNANAQILQKKNGKFVPSYPSFINDAYIAIASMNWFNQNEFEFESSERDYLQHIRQNKAFIFNYQPVEEPCHFQIRLVDADEPVLTAKEYKQVISSSEICTIDIDHPTLLISDPVIKNQARMNETEMKFAIEPGFYKIVVYQFYVPKKTEFFYITLSKTETLSPNEGLHLPCFYRTFPFC